MFSRAVRFAQTPPAVAGPRARTSTTCVPKKNASTRPIPWTSILSFLTFAEKLASRSVSIAMRDFAEPLFEKLYVNVAIPGAQRFLLSSAFMQAHSMTLRSCQNAHVTLIANSPRAEALRELVIESPDWHIAQVDHEGLLALCATRLSHLRYTADNVSGDVIYAISLIGSLSVLDLAGSHQTLNIDIATTVSRLPILQWLSARLPTRDTPTTTIVGLLNRCEQLNRLSLTVGAGTYAEIGLDTLARHPKLRHIDLDIEDHLPPNTIRAITAIHDLSVLSMNHTRLTPHETANLAGMTSLRSLTLSNSIFSHHAAIALAHGTTLSELTFVTTHLTPGVMAALLRVASITQVTYIAQTEDITTAPLDDSNFDDLLYGRHLTSLTLEHPSLTVAAALGFASRPGLHRLCLIAPSFDLQARRIIAETWHSPSTRRHTGYNEMGLQLLASSSALKPSPYRLKERF